MKVLTIAVSPGDGVSCECMDAVLAVLEKAEKYFDGESKLRYVHENIGHDAWTQAGVSMEIDGVTYAGINEEKLAAFDTTDAMIFIAQTSSAFPEGIFSSIDVLRSHYDIYANVRPSKTMPNVFSIKPDIDLVIVRELTEGLWLPYEEEPGCGTAISHVKITQAASERIARHAFELARERNGRKHVLVVHKKNLLRKTFGLFWDACSKVAAEYPDITFEGMKTDDLPYYLIKEPERFDIILTTCLYGDTISGETMGICGDMGVSPSGEYGDNWALFRPMHGSDPGLKGQDVVNPIASILSAVMMLEYLGKKHNLPKVIFAGGRITDAVTQVLSEGKHLTRDLGGSAGTKEVTGAILQAMKE